MRIIENVLIKINEPIQTSSYNRGSREDQTSCSFLVQDSDCRHGNLSKHSFHWVIRAENQWERLMPLSLLIGQDLHLKENVVHT